MSAQPFPDQLDSAHKNTGLAGRAARLAHDLLHVGSSEEVSHANRYIRLAALIALAVVVASSAVLITWYLNQDYVIAFPVLLNMHANAAAGFLLAGISLYLLCLKIRKSPLLKWVAAALGLLVLLLGVAALWQMLSPDPMLQKAFAFLPGHVGDSRVPGLHPLTAFGFIFVGMALMLLDVETRSRYPAEYLACLVLALNAIPFVGHVYGSNMMTHLAYTARMTLDCAFMLLMLGAGLLLARPSHRLMSIITRHAPGGQMLRNSLPQTLVLLLLLDLLIDYGARRMLYDVSAVVPMLTLANIVVVLLVFWRSAAIVNREYEGRLQKTADLADAMSLLIAVSDNTDDAIFVRNRKGQLIFANPATLRQIGKTRAESMYRTNRELLESQEEADRIDQDDMRIMQNGVPVTIEQTLHLPQGIRTFTSSLSPWFDQQGRVMGVVGISSDITQRKQQEDMLRERETQLEATIANRTVALRQLADHMETVREEEKRAIARELHDDMGANLTSLSMHLETAYSVFPQETAWQERKAKMQDLLAAIVAITRRIQTELRPTMLDLFGLKAAIHEQMEEFAKHTGIICKVSVPDEDIAISHKLEITAYRMLQETLNNVAKHAKAKHVDVILDVDEDRLALTVRDDGIGIKTSRVENTTTYGLRGLHERATFLGGKVHIAPNKSQGTAVSIELPVALP